MNSEKKEIKPSIVFVITSLQGSGAESFVLALGKGFYQLGFDVHVVLLSQLIEFDLEPNLHYHTFEYQRFRNIPFRAMKYRIMAKVFDKFLALNIPNCRLVLSNLIRTDRMTCHSRYAPVAHIIHNTFSLEYESALRRKPKKTIHQFSKIFANHPCVCVSKGVEQDFQQIFTDIQTTTIYNAFDQDKILHQADVLISDLKDLPKKYLLHIGKFKKQKAHDVLLKAYAKSSQKYPLVLLGKGQLFEPMKLLAKKLGIADKVHFLGFKKNPYPYIKNATALVLSSRYEGFGRVIAEAQILNTPVISTDCPSGPNEVLPAKNLVDVDDIDALAKKMIEMMANPNEFISPFDEKFLPKNIAQQYLNYFKITD